MVGFTATKKVGKAVVRNKAKRVLRALFIKYSDRLKSGKYVFVANKNIVDNDYKTIEKDFIYTVKKLELLN
jgi:ribonuclease P protein component